MLLILRVLKKENKPIKRWVYSVPCPNYIWRIDGSHKLVRWRFVIHHGIDCFSWLVVFAGCSPNNRAEISHLLFRGALPKYGRPMKIRTDHGGENSDICHDMIHAKGEESKPVLVGNQRIERHNRALYEQLSSIIREEFYQLESEGVHVFILSIYQESTKPFLNLLLPITAARCQQRKTKPQHNYFGAISDWLPIVRVFYPSMPTNLMSVNFRQVIVPTLLFLKHQTH